jgi:hypothetical protein
MVDFCQIFEVTDNISSMLVFITTVVNTVGYFLKKPTIDFSLI